jgi:hypothetical protein
LLLMVSVAAAMVVSLPACRPRPSENLICFNDLRTPAGSGGNPLGCGCLFSRHPQPLHNYLAVQHEML